MTSPRPKNTLCHGCERRGFLAIGDGRKPTWCRCGPRRTGPLVAAPGFITMFRFESTATASQRERGRLLGNAEIEARDAISAVYPRRPKRLVAAYESAITAHEAFQAECPHPSRSPYQPVFCDVCHAHVECNVAHYRHLVREAGEDFAQEVCV